MSPGSCLSKPLRGIIPPLATPLQDEEKLDHAGLENLVEYVLGGKVHGLFILGSTGEGPSLNYSLRRELVERVCDQVGSRVPILVGITDTSFSEAVHMAEWSAECGASAVVLAPPCYFIPSQEDLCCYVERLAAASSLPLFLYNMPSLTKVAFELSSVARLLQTEKIIGFKDSSAQMVFFLKVKQIVSARPDFSLLMGPEELLAEAVLAGGHGGICGGANLVPQLYVELFEAATARDIPRVQFLREKVLAISNLIYTIGPKESSYLRGLKCALAYSGLCGDYLAEPFRPFNGSERELLIERLRQLDLGIESKTPSAVS